MAVPQSIANRTAAPRTDVRHGVQALLTAAQGFDQLDPKTRRDVATSLVRISSTALQLAERAGQSTPSAIPRAIPPAYALAAGDALSGTAIDRIAPASEQILNAVSFPRFVGELITGVFKAMNESNQQQMTAYVDLIRNVAATTEGFADANIGDAGARTWLAEQFPASYEVRGDDDGNDGFDDPAQMTPEERAEAQAERDDNTRLELRPGASAPTQAAIRTALGLRPGESLSTGNPEALVVPARAALARNRQQMLASMVMMGMQRIVIDGGRLNASMRFHIDASSAAADDRGSRTEFHNEVEVGAKYGLGPWSASGRMKNTIGYVSTERTQTEEEINAEVDLSSSVELIFRTDYVPLERLAGVGDVNRIRVNSLNPDEENRIATEASTSRHGQHQTRRTERSTRLDTDLRPTARSENQTSLETPDPPGETEPNTEPSAASGGSLASGSAVPTDAQTDSNNNKPAANNSAFPEPETETEVVTNAEA